MTSVVKHRNWLPRDVLEFVCWVTQNPTGHGPGQPAQSQLEQEVGLCDLKRLLPTSVIPWHPVHPLVSSHAPPLSDCSFLLIVINYQYENLHNWNKYKECTTDQMGHKITTRKTGYIHTYSHSIHILHSGKNLSPRTLIKLAIEYERLFKQ